jgi:hypothetical protein
MNASPTGSGKEAASPPLTFKEAAAPGPGTRRATTRAATQLDESRRTPQDDTAAARVVPRSWQHPGPMVLANDKEHREICLQCAQLPSLAVVGLAQFGGLHRSIDVLGNQQQVEHPHGVALDQGFQLGRHLSREICLPCRERDHDVIDRPHFDIDVAHSLFSITLRLKPDPRPAAMS